MIHFLKIYNETTAPFHAENSSANALNKVIIKYIIWTFPIKEKMVFLYNVKILRASAASYSGSAWRSMYTIYIRLLNMQSGRPLFSPGSHVKFEWLCSHLCVHTHG